jgi:hypothetical protein
MLVTSCPHEFLKNDAVGTVFWVSGSSVWNMTKFWQKDKKYCERL